MDEMAHDARMSAAQRAERVEPLWRTYRSRYSGSLVRDMIADLLHLITVQGGDPNHEIDIAVRTQAAERDG
ncbi:hypothetical protein [Streptomyces sp. SBT349]|uniref:hypothetical protein n=1 Tax=Streptomyces sp. SBT349 TaxID=1580539 RepID=UPI00066D865F|nr:hypothetical protein [Streptomyces sp. SBT349]